MKRASGLALVMFVVGRARSAASPRIPRRETLLTDDAKPLKEIIVSIARDPITTTLKELGLTSAPPASVR
jgi:hypothetical protein